MAGMNKQDATMVKYQGKNIKVYYGNKYHGGILINVRIIKNKIKQR